VAPLLAEIAGQARRDCARLLLGIADALRPDSPDGSHGHRRAAGISNVHAGLLPQDKSALVDQLRRERGPVAMIGDGINDAPALAAADIGIAVATGTGAAMAAADITLVHGGVGAVADAVLLARATRRIIRQNLGWAFGYNLVLVPWQPSGYCRPCSPQSRWPPAPSPSSATRCGSAASARRAGKRPRQLTTAQ
jgi:hypothetical protein